MENYQNIEVDVLPTEEMTKTLLILRSLTAESLRTASKILNKLANSLDSVDSDSEILKLSSVPYEKEDLSNQEKSSRSRKDTLFSTDSGFVDDCDFSSELDIETGLEVISLEEVSYHCTRKDGWMVVYDKVYDVTEYLEKDSHPGGEDVMLEYLGYDATMAFRGVGHSRGALRMLEKYLVGILPQDERLNFKPFV